MATVTTEAKFTVVTPLFAGGADPKQVELRLPSLKGVLRFWWRALAWSRFRGDLNAIGQHEGRLFGSSTAGQSRVRMRLLLQSGPGTLEAGKVLKSLDAVVGHGARYFGYGVMEAYGSSTKNTKDGQLTRGCLLAPFTFGVELRARDLAQDEVASLRDALVALGTLGGLGAKSRKGYGSLVLQELRIEGEIEWTPPSTMAELGERIAALHRLPADDRLPQFTAFSKDTRHVLLSAGMVEPLELLDRVGREMVRYRSWGRNGKILGGGEESERRFKDDHDLMKGPVQSRLTHPRRIAFGLPHNYGKKPQDQIGPADNNLDRRASPLFVHIHTCGGTPVAVVSFLPARFLPQGKSKISVGGTPVPQVAEQTLFAPLHAFLDRLLDKTTGNDRRRETFIDALEVRS
jgi:CRISPR-associated protein Cmr1